MDENGTDAATAGNQIILVLRKELSCCRIWERNGKRINPLI